MRFSWIWTALALCACDGATVTLAPPAEPAGGGGGLGAEPIAVCPVDYHGELERTIAEVPDRRLQDSLHVQWRLLDKRANASGPSELSSMAGSFRAIVNRAELHGDMHPELAERLRRLSSCYTR